MSITLKVGDGMGAMQRALMKLGQESANTGSAIAKIADGLAVLGGTVAADAQTTKRAQAKVYRDGRDCVAGDELFNVGGMWVRFVELPDGVCVWLPEGRDASAYLSINGIKPIRPGRAIDTTGEEKAAREAGERLSGAIMRKQFPTPSEMRAREKLERTGQATPDSVVGAKWDSALDAQAKRIAEDTLRVFSATQDKIVIGNPATAFDGRWNQWRGGVPGVAADGNGGLGPADRAPAPRAKPTLPEPRPARKRKLAKPEEEL